MKKRVSFFLLFIILVSTSYHFLVKSAFGAPATSTLTLSGDLIIAPGEIKRFNDTDITIKGNVIVENNATLILNRSTVNFDQTQDNQYNVTIRNGGRLEALNSSRITSKNSFQISSQGNSSATLYDTGVSFGTFLAEDLSSIFGSNLNIASGYIIMRDNSSLKLSNSEIKTFRGRPSLTLREYSIASISKTTATDFKLYGNSLLEISDEAYPAKLLGVIRSYESSRVVVRGSSNGWSLEAYDSSSAMLLGIAMKNLDAFKFSKVSIYGMSLARLNAYDSSIVVMQKSKAASMFAYNNSRLYVMADSVVEPSYQVPTGGNIEAYGTSGVFLSKSIVNTLKIHDYSSFYVERATIKQAALVSSSSSLSFKSSSAEILSVSDFSSTTISDSNISSLQVGDHSNLLVENSKVKEIFIRLKSVSVNFSGLLPTRYESWKLIEDGSLAIGSGGYSPSVRFTKTEITQGWSLLFSGATNATLINSAIRYLGMRNSTTIQLVNSTSEAFDMTSEEGEVNVSWYLDVLASNTTTVSVYYADGTVAAPPKNPDDNGLARFTLLGEVMNMSGTYPANQYTMHAIADNKSEVRTFEMTGNIVVDLLPSSSSLWQENLQLIIIIIVIIAVVFVSSFLILRRRKLRLS